MPAYRLITEEQKRQYWPTTKMQVELDVYRYSQGLMSLS